MRRNLVLCPTPHTTSAPVSLFLLQPLIRACRDRQVLHRAPAVVVARFRPAEGPQSRRSSGVRGWHPSLTKLPAEKGLPLDARVASPATPQTAPAPAPKTATHQNDPTTSQTFPPAGTT